MANKLTEFSRLVDIFHVHSQADGNMLIRIYYKADTPGFMARWAIADEIEELLHEHVGKNRYAKHVGKIRRAKKALAAERKSTNANNCRGKP